MKTKTVELPSGVTEIRIYDRDGRLVEIKREQPKRKYDRPVSLLKRHPGTRGGDQY